MVKFVGDLSLQDASVLEHYAANATSILEFGVGGSTQIFAQVAKGTGFSFDTDRGWIERTNLELQKLNLKWKMIHESEWDRKGVFDLIFNDGRDDWRRDLGLLGFSLLKEGGHLIYHDTRRVGDVLNVTKLIETYFNEIDEIHMNMWHSNMTVIRKKAAEPYVNWHAIEGKPEWMYGNGDKPDA